MSKMSREVVMISNVDGHKVYAREFVFRSTAFASLVVHTFWLITTLLTVLQFAREYTEVNSPI